MVNDSSRDTTARVEDTGRPPNRFDAIVLSWIYPEGLRGGIRLERGHTSIGRGPECDLRIDAASVSRKHCEVYRDGPVFALRDLASTNGTFLNGKRVEHAALAQGDVLRIGDAVAFVEPPDAPLGAHAIEQLAPDLMGGPDLARVLDAAHRAAPSTLPIVLIGETGTGKERVARAIHDWSRRADGFHAINCAALPHDLAEAELFGYRRGAFTGAQHASAGRLLAARAGTLLLDEIADLSLPIQAKLLRVIEERRVFPLGEATGVPFEARIVSATQRSLDDLVKDGVFRRDLRARLAGLSVELPALHRRKADILPLFQHFLRTHSGGRPPAIEAKLAESLVLHKWPDNVRELELVARSLLALRGSEPVLRRTFLAEVQSQTAQAVSGRAAESAFPKRKEHDLHHFVVALQTTSGNVAKAAAMLGFSRQRAYRLMAGKTATELLSSCGPDLRRKSSNGSRPE